MDWSPLIAIAGLVLGAIATGVAGWIGYKFIGINAKAQADAKIKEQAEQDRAALQIAQNHFITLQKIGQVAAGVIEQTNKDAPPKIKEQLAQDYAQSVLLPQAGMTATPEETLPGVLAGVALLPDTHPVAPTIDSESKG
jgi:hypothetical protein